MPKRTDIKSVMVIGSGPIVIGQAAEFDYSGTQACRVLREEGIRVILVNSNPATIMTDPEMADATYIEPISTPILEQIIAKERPDALLPTLGGQTALNAAMALGEAGVLKKYNVELIGASLEAIDRGEDRELFKKVVEEAGAESARSDIAHSIEAVDKIAQKFGYPLGVRPSFHMRCLGSGIQRITCRNQRVIQKTEHIMCGIKRPGQPVHQFFRIRQGIQHRRHIFIRCVNQDPHIIQQINQFIGRTSERR